MCLYDEGDKKARNAVIHTLFETQLNKNISTRIQQYSTLNLKLKKISSWISKNRFCPPLLWSSQDLTDDSWTSAPKTSISRTGWRKFYLYHWSGWNSMVCAAGRELLQNRFSGRGPKCRGQKKSRKEINLCLKHQFQNREGINPYLRHESQFSPQKGMGTRGDSVPNQSQNASSTG